MMRSDEVNNILMLLGSAHFTDSPGIFPQRYGEPAPQATEGNRLSVLIRERDRLAEQLKMKSREYDELVRSLGSTKRLRTV
ncbi:hypothetical protein OOT00_03150 [Desulfobotulus sp. H1]|uniref:Uncharacterized protein n=1 Tax=Desulfobotulus pelophilus TaxID=2823377 RepID=A0ABT3N694_9BACT|nr:hypothetical protein [Desulfobotulus pelophilus]MCW7752978.1 hypothetical protein [Desulfobotulus pelophilus]